MPSRPGSLVPRSRNAPGTDAWYAIMDHLKLLEVRRRQYNGCLARCWGTLLLIDSNKDSDQEYFRRLLDRKHPVNTSRHSDGPSLMIFVASGDLFLWSALLIS